MVQPVSQKTLQKSPKVWLMQESPNRASSKGETLEMPPQGVGRQEKLPLAWKLPSLRQLISGSPTGK